MSNDESWKEKGLRVVQGSRRSVTGVDLHTVQCLPPPEKDTVAVLCWHHGLQEHVNRYLGGEFELWAERYGIAVYSYDMVGHGQSGGRRGYIDSFSQVVDDFVSLAESARSVSEIPPNRKSIPIFLGGHSLGGLVAAMAVLRNQSAYAGLLLSSPAINVEWTPLLRVQAAIGGLLAAMVPKARIVPAVKPEAMNKDPKKVEEYLNDPLNCPQPVAARTANETLLAFKELDRRKSELWIPVYAHHGTADACTSFPATRAFMEGLVEVNDKTFIPVDGGYHEVLFEERGAEIANGMGEWMVKRAGTSDAMPRM
jgi:acylglycerol lipase